MPHSWEGNRRSGVALAMRHGLSGLSAYGLNDHRKGDEHSAYASERHGMHYLLTETGKNICQQKQCELPIYETTRIIKH